MEGGALITGSFFLYFQSRLEIAKNAQSFMKGEIYMTYKQIEASREARLWLGQILVPAVTLAVSTLAIPGVKDALAKKVDDVKRSLKNKKN